MRVNFDTYMILRKGLLLIGLVLLFSCEKLHDDLPYCANTRLIYLYNRENTETENMLPLYINSVTEYIFDANGILRAINTLPGNSSFGRYISEIDLPEGRYTVISWGNKANQSKTNNEQIGVTTKQEMMLYLDNAYAAAKSTPAMQSNAERLYYGYRTFTVGNEGISEVNVNMTHAHCVLNVFVKWKNEAEAPQNTGDFYMVIRDIASQQAFIPEYTFRGKTLMNYTPDVDTYQKNPTTIRHNIPVVDTYSPLLEHRTAATMSYEQVLNGEFVTYRHRNLSQPLLSVYAGGNRLMKEINLQRFFQDMGIELDTNLRQEFDIEVEIDGDKVSVVMVTVEDWDDGGVM